MAKILLVEDEHKIGELLTEQLEADQNIVTWIMDGAEALSEIRIEKFDMMIFDLMLPKVSGEELVKELRSFDKETPVLALTAKGTVNEIIIGLDGGFDDYLPKPFSYSELAARIRALLRRSTNGEVILEARDLKLDPKTKIVRRAGTEIDLTNKEYQLLEYLLRRKGQFITQEEILEKVWDRNYEGFSNTVAVHMKNIKQKINKAFSGSDELIISERGKGYKIDD
jgi:two-component system OmpR family response regulator